MIMQVIVSFVRMIISVKRPSHALEDNSRYRISSMLISPVPPQTNNLHHWRALFNLTVLSAYFYAFMEWLFFATKPSSLSLLSSFDSLKVLFITAGTVALVVIVFLLFLCLPALFISNSNWQSRVLTVGTIVPTLLLSI